MSKRKLLLLALELLVQLGLLLLLLLECLPRLLQFLLLLLGDLDCLRADDHLLLHFLEPIDQFLLFGLRLFLRLFPLPDFVEDPVLLRFLQIGLVLDLFLILLGLHFDLLLLLLQSLLELRHLLFVFNLDNLLDDVADDALLLVESLEVTTLVQ